MATKNLGNVAGVVRGANPPVEADGVTEKRYVLWAKELPTIPTSYQLMYYDIFSQDWQPLVSIKGSEFDLLKYTLFGSLNLPNLQETHGRDNLLAVIKDVKDSIPDMDGYVTKELFNAEIAKILNGALEEFDSFAEIQSKILELIETDNGLVTITAFEAYKQSIQNALLNKIDKPTAEQQSEFPMPKRAYYSGNNSWEDLTKEVEDIVTEMRSFKAPVTLTTNGFALNINGLPDVTSDPSFSMRIKQNPNTKQIGVHSGADINLTLSDELQVANNNNNISNYITNFQYSNAIRQNIEDVYPEHWIISQYMKTIKESDFTEAQASDWLYFTRPDYSNGEPLFEFSNGVLRQKVGSPRFEACQGGVKFNKALPMNKNWSIRFDCFAFGSDGTSRAGLVDIGLEIQKDLSIFNYPTLSILKNTKSNHYSTLLLGNHINFNGHTQNLYDTYIVTKYSNILNITMFNKTSNTIISTNIDITNIDSEELYFTIGVGGKSQYSSYDWAGNLKINNFRYFIDERNIEITNPISEYQTKLTEFKEKVKAQALTKMRSWEFSHINGTPEQYYTNTENSISVFTKNNTEVNKIPMSSVVSEATSETTLPYDRNWYYETEIQLGQTRGHYGGTIVAGIQDALSNSDYLYISTGQSKVNVNTITHDTDTSLSAGDVVIPIIVKFYNLDGKLTMELYQDNILISTKSCPSINAKVFIKYSKYKNEYKNTGVMNKGVYYLE